MIVMKAVVWQQPSPFASGESGLALLQFGSTVLRFQLVPTPSLAMPAIKKRTTCCDLRSAMRVCLLRIKIQDSHRNALG